MTATSTTDRATDSQASHLGTLAPSSDLRMSTRYATATTASTTIAINSCVIPLVRCPNPLKMRSQCSRWKNTAIPPTARRTALAIQAGTCARLPVPNAAISACVPNSPALHATSVVNTIKGHWSSIIHRLLATYDRAGYTRTMDRCQRWEDDGHPIRRTAARIPQALCESCSASRTRRRRP